MDLSSLSFYKDIILTVAKDTNKNIIAFVWSENKIEPVWIFEDLKVQPFSFLEKTFSHVGLHEDANGRLEVRFSFPIANKKTLYLVKSTGPLNYSLVFKEDGVISKLKEVFVKMAESPNVCLCRCETVDGKEFVETSPIDLGPLAQFM
jgi:hypothetical protein